MNKEWSKARRRFEEARAKLREVPSIRSAALAFLLSSVAEYAS